MICKYCCGTFKAKGKRYCPYCEMEIPEEELDIDIEEENKPKAPEVSPYAKWGIARFTVHNSKNPLSPADGTTYVFTVDGYYEAKIVLGKEVEIKELELPFGEHEVELIAYGWDDETLSEPLSYVEVKPLELTVGERIPHIHLKVSTLFTPHVMSIIYEDN